MFETENFRSQLEDAISSEAAQANITEYRTSIVRYLQNLALENEAVLMEREVKKLAGRRGMADALASARQLVREAALYSRSENRTTLYLEDVKKAYQVNFCRFWPFCR